MRRIERQLKSSRVKRIGHVSAEGLIKATTEVRNTHILKHSHTPKNTRIYICVYSYIYVYITRSNSRKTSRRIYSWMSCSFFVSQQIATDSNLKSNQENVMLTLLNSKLKAQMKNSCVSHRFLIPLYELSLAQIFFKLI